MKKARSNAGFLHVARDVFRAVSVQERADDLLDENKCRLVVWQRQTNTSDHSCITS
jgi:hypothetical protein